jgi:hypothetical protein
MKKLKLFQKENIRKMKLYNKKKMFQILWIKKKLKIIQSIAKYRKSLKTNKIMNNFNSKILVNQRIQKFKIYSKIYKINW